MSRDREGIGERTWNFLQQNDKSRDHSGENNRQLILLRVSDSVGATRHRIHNHRDAAGDNRQRQRPPKHGRKHNCRRVNRDPRADSALQKKQSRRQQPRLRIEPPAQKFVRRVHIQLPIQRQKYRRYNHQRDGHREIILNERQAARIPLPRRRKKRDRRRLRRHDRKPNDEPRLLLFAAQIVVQIPPPARAQNAIQRDRKNGPKKHPVIESVHAKALDNHRSATTDSTNEMRMNAYKRGHEETNGSPVRSPSESVGK